MDLEDLPECQGDNKCKNCGAENWGVARTDNKGNVVMCNKCPEVPEDWDPLKEDQ